MTTITIVTFCRRIRRLLAILLVSLPLGHCAVIGAFGTDAALTRLERKASDAYQTGHYPEAREYWQQALELAVPSGDALRIARLQLALARLDENTGRYALALSHGQQAWTTARSLNDARLNGQAQNLLALAYRRTGNFTLARTHAEAALDIANIHREVGMASDSLRNLGAIRQAGGDFAGALQYYREALTQAYAGNDMAREALVLNNMGGLYRLQAAYQQALQYYDSALLLESERHDLAGQTKVLGNLCLVHKELNALTQALQYCQRALRIANSIGDLPREANNHNNIGAIYRQSGQLGPALKHYLRALALKREIADQPGEARTLNNIGELYLVRGEFEQASHYFEDSLQLLDAVGDSSGASAAHYNLGLIQRRRGAAQQSLGHFKQALTIQLQVGERELLWRIYADLSGVYAELDSPQVAIFFGKLAVNTLQSIRGGIRQLDQALQRSFLADKSRAYRHLAGLLVDQGRLPEAQRVLDMLKEEEYRDFAVRGDGEDPVETRSGFAAREQPFAEQLEAFGTELVALTQANEELRQKLQQGIPLSPQEQTRYDLAKQQIRRAETALDQIFARLGPTLSPPTQISEVDQETLDGLFELQGTIGDVSDRAGTKAVMLHYLVTEDRLYVILTTPLIQVLRQTAVSARELNHRIQDLRSALLSPSTEATTPAAALYQLLIAPIAADLEQAGAELLWVSMDGALRYIPLTALYDRQHARWLAEDYAVAMLTEATKTSWKDVPRRDWKVAGLGLSQKVEGYSRLTAVADELDGIVRQEDRDDPVGVLPGVINLDNSFNAAALEAILESQRFPVIHIASHFVLPRDGNAENSFLILGDGAQLSLKRFQRFRFFRVELLTLSACNTAVGEQGMSTAQNDDSREFDMVSGREVDGLGALVQRRGASSVLATLWEVADSATATFMQRFYRLRTEGRSKAEALRAAQLTFINPPPDAEVGARTGVRGAAPLDEPEGDAGYGHPYFWGPFILMGNWL